MLKTSGIHHVSSIVGDALRSNDFYTKILSLRLVKTTLNYDDRDHYHLYYGNKDASNGIVTTFPMNNTVSGRIGDGQVGYVTYSIPKGSLNFWEHRLKEHNVEIKRYKQFNRERLRFFEPDGLELEFVENDSDNNAWEYNDVKKNQAFGGILGAALYSKLPEETLNLLVDVLGYEIADEDEEFYQLKTAGNVNQFLELSKTSYGHGQVAIGTVHHIAYEVNDEEIDAWRKLLLDKGYKPTKVKDRNYFKSIYFREPGGILFELATKGPGLLVDETIENLGQKFIIPKHFQKYEAQIKENLKPLKFSG